MRKASELMPRVLNKIKNKKVIDMLTAKRNDPISSFDAAREMEQTARQHRAIVRKALEEKPNMTGREIERHINYALDYHQVMRRVSEVASRGELRECSTGIPSKRVVEWYL